MHAWDYDTPVGICLSSNKNGKTLCIETIRIILESNNINLEMAIESQHTN